MSPDNPMMLTTFPVGQVQVHSNCVWNPTSKFRSRYGVFEPLWQRKHGKSRHLALVIHVAWDTLSCKALKWLNGLYIKIKSKKPRQTPRKRLLCTHQALSSEVAEERPGGDSGNHTENSGCWRGVRVSVSPVETALSSRASLSSRRPSWSNCRIAVTLWKPK